MKFKKVTFYKKVRKSCEIVVFVSLLMASSSVNLKDVKLWENELRVFRSILRDGFSCFHQLLVTNTRGKYRKIFFAKQDLRAKYLQKEQNFFTF